MRRPPRHRPLPLPVAEDVRRELRFHLEMRARELREQGMSPEQARRLAEQAFGDYARVARECRHVSSSPRPRRRFTDMLESFLMDVRFALRNLRKSPGFVAVAMLTLALGIGANTAVFSVVNGVLLRPLPYPDADRIVAVWEATDDGSSTFASVRNFLDWRAGADSFESMSLYPSYAFSAPATVLGGKLPTRAWLVGVTKGFFDTLGVEPERGRGFSDEEYATGGVAAVIVSHAFWESVLGADPDLSSLEVRAYGTAAPVVGVMPAGFTYPAETDIWWPLSTANAPPSRTAHGYEVVGRLRPGVSIEAASAELTAIHEGILAQDPEDAQHPGIVVRSLRDELYGDARGPLMLLAGAAGLVLLVACTNLASALLARGSARERELAIRTSLGAHRSRIVRQLFTETALLGVLGALAGVVTGGLAVDGLLRLSPDSVPRPEAIGLDASVLGFAVGLSLLTTLLFGLLPSMRVSRSGVGAALRAGSRGSAGGRGRLWSWLVGTEVLLAVLLLVASGLLVRSFRQVLRSDPGFEPAGVLTVDLSLPSGLYPDNPDLVPVLHRILDEVETLPGVTAAGVVNNLPFSGTSINGGFQIEGRPAEEGGYGDYRVASPDYFEAMGIPLVRGRGFRDSDDAESPHVALINAAAAERYWPGEDPIGRRILQLANDSWVYDQPATIVGVVGNVRHRSLTRPPVPEVYLDYAQRPMRIRSSILALRTSGRAADLVASVRDRIQAIDDQIPLEFTTMEARIGRSVNDRRFVVTVIGAFSLVALLLAAVGIYGVVSYSTARRTREIGIRMALGAAPAAVRRLVIRDSLAVVILGVVAGVIAALFGSRLLASLLYDVSPTDPATFVTVVVVLVGAAWLASAVPAWRGARVDPMVTMREE